jgi:hypothetical protein
VSRTFIVYNLYSYFLSNYLIFQGEVQEKARVLQTLKVNDVCNLH